MAAFFSDNQLRQILQSVDIVDLVSHYVALKRSGREFLGLCPFHDDRRPSMTVSPAKQIFKCFACGAGGDAIKFLMLRERLSFPEAVRLMAERVGIELAPETPGSRGGSGESSLSRSELEAVNRWAGRYYVNCLRDEGLGRQAREYISSRGINDEMVKRFGLGFAPERGETMIAEAGKAGFDRDRLEQAGLLIHRQGQPFSRFRNRLMFPVIDALGRVVGFGGRTLGDDPAKYLNSSESVLFNKSRALYGIHAAKDSIVKHRQAVVVEGYTDCLMAHQFGIERVVATLGTALTEENARSLSRYAERIVLVFDSDTAGQKAAERGVEVFFGLGVQVRLAAVSEGKDPCDFLLSQGAEAFEAMLSESIDALDFKWQRTRELLSASESPLGRRRATESFLQFVAEGMAHGGIDPITRGYILNDVARLVGLSVGEVQQIVNRMSRQSSRRQAWRANHQQSSVPMAGPSAGTRSTAKPSAEAEDHGSGPVEKSQAVPEQLVSEMEAAAAEQAGQEGSGYVGELGGYAGGIGGDVGQPASPPIQWDRQIATEPQLEPETRSFREMLEVLLNCGDLIARAREVVPDASSCPNATLRAIAERLWRAHDQNGWVEPVEVMAACEDTVLCGIMADLLARGADRAEYEPRRRNETRGRQDEAQIRENEARVRQNHEQTLEGALANIQRLRDQQAWRTLREKAVQAGQCYGEDAEAAMLLEIQAKCRPDPRRPGGALGV